ncbi:MAG: glycoside hydrolase family 2 protein [Armatimonadota bacterium]
MRISLSGSDWMILGLVPTEWVWRRIGEPDVDLDNLNPPVPPWVPAVVPGDVQSDLLDAGVIPDPDVDLNSRACEWTSQRDWVYRKQFRLGTDGVGKRSFLRFEGVDYSCHVFLNGCKLGCHEGTFTPFEFDVSNVVHWGGDNTLVVVVDHGPSEPSVQGQIGWTSRIRLWKPRFAYDWDWCTRLVPLGIWDDVTLITADRARITDVWVRPEVALEDGSGPHAVVHVSVSVDVLSQFVGAVEVTLVDPNGRRCGTLDADVSWEAGAQTFQGDVELLNPRLWYPNGSGDQPLYRAHVSLKAHGAVLDERSVRFGVRQIRALSNDGAPPDALPYVLEVNGIKTFIKGWNWVPVYQLYGRRREQEYRHAVRMAKEANCNLLRVWGGGLLERELFYDLCDEAGIMVWQEFPQSSSGIDNEPASDAEHLEYVRSQAEQMVPRRRNHPCLVIWCGGNELFTSDYRPLGFDHSNIAVLKSVVERLDPGRIFLPTSPSGPVFGASPDLKSKMHDVHGNWSYMGDPEHYRFFNSIDPLLHSEFGTEGAANLHTLRRILSRPYLWPPDKTNEAWVHHGAWWINRQRVEELFGPIGGIEEFVHASQWVQAEGLRYAVEASRRRKWRTSGAIPWQFNESWPNASCTNVLDRFGHPKPAYWIIRSAYASYLISAEYERLRWEPRSEFAARVWVNASQPLPEGCEATWEWFDAVGGECTAGGSVGRVLFSQAPTAIHVGDVWLALPETPGVFALRLMLRSGEKVLARNEYLFSTHKGSAFAPILRAPRRSLSVTAGKPLVLTATGGPVYGLTIGAVSDWSQPYLTDGYRMFVAAGEEVRIGWSGSGRVRIWGWNVCPLELELG